MTNLLISEQPILAFAFFLYNSLGYFSYNIPPLLFHSVWSTEDVQLLCKLQHKVTNGIDAPSFWMEFSAADAETFMYYER